MGSAPSTNVKANFRKGNIQIKTDKTIYNPGDQVSGRIYLQTYSILLPSTLSFTLYGVEFYGVLIGDRKPVHRTNRRKIINFTQCLHKWESEVPHGDYEIPFSFILPQGLPSSFNHEAKTFMAHITYNMIIKLEANQKPEKTDTITKCQKLFIEQTIKRASTSYTEQRTFPVRSWCCVPQGSVTYKAKFNKNVFKPGEKAELKLEIDNSKNKLMNNHFNFRLVQLITLGGRKYHEIKANRNIQLDIPAGASPRTQVFSFDLVSKFRDHNHDLDIRDHYFPRGGDSGFGVIGQITQGKLVRSVYYLEIRAGMDAFCSPDKIILCNNVGMIFSDPSPHHFCLPNPWSPQVLPSVVIEIPLNLESAKNVKKIRDAGEAEIL